MDEIPLTLSVSVPNMQYKSVTGVTQALYCRVLSAIFGSSRRLEQFLQTLLHGLSARLQCHVRPRIERFPARQTPTSVIACGRAAIGRRWPCAIACCMWSSVLAFSQTL